MAPPLIQLRTSYYKKDLEIYQKIKLERYIIKTPNSLIYSQGDAMQLKNSYYTWDLKIYLKSLISFCIGKAVVSKYLMLKKSLKIINNDNLIN